MQSNRYKAMDKRAFKDQAYTEISRITKALSGPARLEIIDFIANGPKSVEEIARQTALNIANASQHLQVLKKERLVKTTRKGNFVYYSLASEEVYYVWKSLRDLTLNTSPIVSQLLTETRNAYEIPEPVVWEDVKGRNDVFLLDVRPKDEFEKGSMANAVSLPLDELTDKLDIIPRDKMVLTYCRGMFCFYADEAVQLLQSKGYNARRLEEGVLDVKETDK